MDIVVVTGSAGLVGSEAVHFFADKFDLVVGVDNEMRRTLFGEAGSVSRNRDSVQALPNYVHHQADIRDSEAIARVFDLYGTDIRFVVHTAGQPSHEWATDQTLADFEINALGTVTVLEAVRRHCPEAVVVHTSTNKVYGDEPNRLPLVELDTRWDIAPEHPFHQYGIDESMQLDRTDRTFFGVSKLAADAAAQEYGRRLGMKVGVFRCSCLTGPRHAGVPLHGFLSHLARCAVTGAPYTVLGHKGKQVRDNLDARDLVRMFWHFYLNPRPGEVYHAGGGRSRSCSVTEAAALCSELTGREMTMHYEPEHRFADVKCWISDTRKFGDHYPDWLPEHEMVDTVRAIVNHWTAIHREDGKVTINA